MSTKQDQKTADPRAAGQAGEQRPSNAQKDPRDWKTGDEPMTGAQASYLHTLAEQQGEEVPDDMTKAEASEKIDELRDAAGVSGGAGGAAGVENTRKDPEQWKTGDEPMTGAQASYLQTLSQEAGVDFDASLTKAEASKRIDELQAKTGRGQKLRE
ncbi:DUF3072 domain-containing protein [Sorangium sp. So ce119]|uniref:DUF3072 domain-containing protein n=1 Tax=Sorangium sp. So ce119 TaxID=3133279 RepID=UPI003F5DB089